MPEPTTLLPEIEAPPVALAMEGSRRLRLMGLGVVLSVSLIHFVIGAVYSLFRVQNAPQIGRAHV